MDGVGDVVILGARVLVKPDDMAEGFDALKEKGFIIAPSVEGRVQFEEQWGTVVNVGDAVEESWARVGDRVMISKHGGATTMMGDAYYRIVMDDDIIMRTRRKGE